MSYNYSKNLSGLEDFETATFTKFFFNDANQMTGIQTENTTGAVVEEDGLSEASLAEIAVSPGNVTTDANGNITEIVLDDGTYSFSFDYENRLIEARYPDGLVFEFEYDGLGRRVLTRVNGEGVRYIYDGSV